MMGSIKYIDLGLTDYQKGWDFQETKMLEVQKARNEESPKNFLVFCEHPHVYTLGKSGNENNLLLNQVQLQTKEAQFIKTNRGGDITYHGPGQIIGYPILDLIFLNIGIKTYICQLEQCIINFLAEYDIKGGRNKKATGVWLDIGTMYERKICSFGVRVSRSVTMHGFALNVNTDLDYFSFINPCGFTDKGVTSIQKELGEKINIQLAKELLKNHFLKNFDAKNGKQTMADK